MENTKRYELKKIQTNFPQEQITTSKAASDFIRNFYGDDIEVFESFFILLLNQSNTTIGYAKISQGGIASTVVDVRLIAKYAIEALATSVIIAHNHPSGSLTPSRADISLTNKVVNALELLDIRMLDHIIITADGYRSMADNNDY